VRGEMPEQAGGSRVSGDDHGHGGGPDRLADITVASGQDAAAGPGSDGRPGAGPTRDLPSGTVTLLFSDIEGSTALLSRLGERYAAALSAQRALLRDAFRQYRGRELGTEGDSFFVVFESAGDAVGCCVEAQRALVGHDWPGGEVVRVRMGLHSGEPARYEDGYIGMDVHRAARIAAAAHGGQVVLSDATRLLADSWLSSAVSVRDLGFHRLKDIEAAEHVYQLVAPGLPERFPPLRSLGAQTSLPVPLTPLVGRDAELGRVCAALTGPEVRLVTLTGTGGVGKTRLALATAAALGQAFPHGVFFIALAPVRDAGVMWKTIAGGLDVSDGPAPDAVTGYLGDRRALLVLDNLEQLDGAAEVVAELLAAAPGLVVLATSRRPLHLRGEHEQPVPPLEIPRDAEVGQVAACGAPRLFVQHAAMVRPGFTLTEANAADIAAICRRLDGLPLAIELAASRVRLLAPRALLARLRHSLDLAAANVGQPLRQQTLRNTIAWSYDLLTSESADVLRRAGVFAGGCDLDALAAVAMGEQDQGTESDPLQVAAELLDVSLITVTEGADGEPRVGMLETIRQYALERLEQTGDLDDTRRRHARYYAVFAEQANGQLIGPADLAALDRLEAEHDNLRAALSWSLDTQAADPAGDAERAATGLRLVQALASFWYRHGHATEGRRWLPRAIDLATDDGGAPLAKLAHSLGMLLVQQGELEAGLGLFERSLAIWRDLGDRTQQARELTSLGGTYRRLDDLDTARSLLEDGVALCRESGSEIWLGNALTVLGGVESAAGNFDRAAQALQEAIMIGRKQGNTLGAALGQQSLAVNCLLAGRAQEARDVLSGILGFVVSSGDTEWLIDALEVAAAIAAELGDCLRAARLIGAAEAARQLAGMPTTEADAALLERSLGPARATIAPDVWDAEQAVGRALTQQETAALLLSPTPAPH
jgi:predicted ATPase/class 3 adenylate cyclase